MFFVAVYGFACRGKVPDLHIFKFPDAVVVVCGRRSLQPLFGFELVIKRDGRYPDQGFALREGALNMNDAIVTSEKYILRFVNRAFCLFF